MNTDLAVRGRFFEIDALWEEHRVAVELDSRAVHGTRKRFESDRHRDRILVAEGWKTTSPGGSCRRNRRRSRLT